MEIFYNANFQRLQFCGQILDLLSAAIVRRHYRCYFVGEIVADEEKGEN